MSNKGCGIIRIPPPDADINASNGAIDNLIELSGTFFNEVMVFDYVFTDDERVTCIPLEKQHRHHPVRGILTHISYQYRLCKSIWKHRNNLGMTLWHAGGFSLLFPLILTKLLGIEVLLFVLGEPRKGYQHMEQGRFLKRRVVPKLLLVLEIFSFTICDRIVVFNEGILDYSLLDRFAHKTSQLRFNFEEIPTEIDPSERGNTLIFLGRICELKGADKFAKAVDLLFERGNVDVDEVLFVGDGPTKERWEEYFEEIDTDDSVTFTGWVPRQEAMERLESAKVLVLPSKSEGLPKTLIEAMARGVVPVVTPVGNIPEVITDGEDGILLEDASPENITTEIETLMTDGRANEVAVQSHQTAKEQFNFQAARDDFEALLAEVQ